MIELRKKEKKIARAAIEKGILAECKVALEKAETNIVEWRNNKLDNTQAYHKLFESVNQENKNIAQRYDDMRGSRYLLTVAAILHDGLHNRARYKRFI